ncbi:MAG: 16S rRNA (uracil(1498)-N(3))-methyltransferase [Clostridiales bacterium]|nr:16S rRNA (uracil(1498)-N(3))-methyltransferase [Clostridiales bacterium]
MHNFFIDKTNIIGDLVNIDGEHFNHILNVLRMRVGDEFLVTFDQSCHLCQIKEIFQTSLTAQITQRDYLDSNLSIDLYLFQGLPKSDKLELIIQKAVELGVKEIIPVQMERSIAKIEQNKVKQKTQRFNAIAQSAAEQSKRTIIPQVLEPLSFTLALEKAKELDLLLVPYENQKGILSTKEALSLIKKGDKVGVIIGPEGGFSPNEIALAEKDGGKLISLGKRILRTETAAITALSMLMLHAEMNLD